MQRGTTVADPQLPVVLSEGAKAERADKIARLEGDIERMEKQLANDIDEFKNEVKDRKKAINERRQEVYRLAEVIRRQEEYRDQSTLKFDEDPRNERKEPNQAQAAHALAQVGATAEAQESTAVEFDEATPPTTCGKCGKGVRQILAGFMCESSSADGAEACDWVARPAGKKLDGTPIEVPAAETAPAEGQASETDKCVGCGVDLQGVERVKGLCDTCQTQKPGEDPLAGTPEAAPADAAETVTQEPTGETHPPEEFTPTADDVDWVDGKTEADVEHAVKARKKRQAKVEEQPAEDDDPRPRCSKCKDVLDADEVEKGIGICQACIDAGEAVPA